MKLDLASSPVGEPPRGFSAGLTGQGEAVHWQVTEDTSASGGKVIAETSRDTADYRFPLCIYDGAVERDVEVSVLFKPVAGEVDQAGGVIARARDSENYYVVRANALEANVRLYKVTEGIRRQIAGHNTEVKSGVWHRLSLTVIGDQLDVTFDGTSVLSARDQTFSEPGKAGLWTKADSLTHFAECNIRTI